jgi:hypothetical protein
LQDENDELRKLMGWLSGHEPQLRIMIESFKRQEVERISQSHQKPTTKIISLPNLTILGTD